MTAAAPSIRERVGKWIAFGGKRAEPIAFETGYQGENFGPGLGSNQPDAEILLRESVGVPAMAERAIANRISGLRLRVMTSRMASAGTMEDEELDNHVIAELLATPHPTFTIQQTLRLTTQYIVTVGEAYLLKIRNGFGLPTALSPMPPANVTPSIDHGMVTSYIVKDARGNVKSIPESEVIRIWFPDPETIYSAEGYLGPNGVVTDAHKFAQEHLRSRYQNDATPHIVLKGAEGAATSTDEQWQRWQKDWLRKYHNRAGSKRGLPAALPTGWDIIQMAMASGADIAPLLEYWQTNQLMNYGTPASILGRVVSGDRSSAETNQWVFDRYTCLPITRLIEEALTAKLAMEFDDRLFIKFEDFVSEDKEFKLKQEEADTRNKVRSPQQILRDRGCDPDDAPWGELPVGTFNEAPYTGEADAFELVPDDPTAMDDDDPEDDGPRSLTTDRGTSFDRARAAAHFDPEREWQRVMAREKKFKPRLARAMRGIFEAQRKEAIRLLEMQTLIDDRARASVEAGTIFDEAKWFELYQTRIDPIRKAAYVASGAEALAGLSLAQEFIFSDVVAQYLSEEGARLVTMTSRTTRNRLAKALAEGQLEGEGVSGMTKRVNSVFAGRRRNAETIARTELLKATQHAQIEGFVQSGVVEKKQWNDNRDPQVRDSHVASNIAAVPLNQPFTLGNGRTAMGPGDSTLPADDVVNCRCFVTPVIQES